ncbi:MAG: UDP-N-acetylmuramate dehydrogenase [Calditerrivibrio sp.]|nr:UDP-N-acetylmuramate dehydrogenase [Calditerrivibrio sp.]
MQDLNDILKKDELLSKHCSYRVGGPAKYFATPRNEYELLAVEEFILKNNLKYLLLGGGTNILFDDRGFNGCVLSLKHLNRYIFIDGETVVAGAGILLDDLVKYTLENNLSGMEDLSGIPGTVGGSVFMNAGAFQCEIKDIVKNIKLMENGKIFTIENSEAGFGYRQSRLHGKKILEVSIQLKKGGINSLIRREEILFKRWDKQPLEYPSCGSVFKRPSGGYAGKLIEDSGLKGFSIGGAKISEKHANFIVNFNNATGRDIRELINHIKKTVMEKFGVLLEEEVKIIDF